jgi:glycerol-3-phosphate dehydrogenase
MNREAMLAQVVEPRMWDMLVIGGGATGVGVAVDAASRGYRTLLLEQGDFGQGTSSRSTKLVHGGVRYLEQGNISLVIEALKERGTLRANAPHLVSELPFIVPSYEWWQSPFYGLGLKVYNLLAGQYGFGSSRILSRAETLQRLPTIRTEGLRGGVVYYDGQFDDARLLIALVQTAADAGAALLNYAPVVALHRGDDGFVAGASFQDLESGKRHEVRARVVVNATGAFADSVRRMGNIEGTEDADIDPIIAPSQGVHLVFDRSFLPGESAIMVPHTSDGRVMFAIPWLGHTLVGTTDTPLDSVPLEPVAREEEIEFILTTAGLYLEKRPRRADALSVFAGIRPLVRAGRGAQGKGTAALSRDHAIHIDESGLLTIAGGKWTTYRRMAEDCVDQAAFLGRLPETPCRTRELRVHGFDDGSPAVAGHLRAYGTDRDQVQEIARQAPHLGQQLHPDLPYIGAEVVWAARAEMARRVEDVLARRTRALFLNAAAAREIAPAATRLLAQELGRDEAWERQQVLAFAQLARGYEAGHEKTPPEGGV